MTFSSNRTTSHRNGRRGNLRHVLGAVVLAVVAFGVTAARPAQAQERVVQEADRTVYRERTVIDFTGVVLEGELKKPSGTVMLHRGRTEFDSLIRLRGDFQQELEKSVEQL